MGELKVGDDSYNGLAQEKQINNNASKNMELECAMGSVVVEFKYNTAGQRYFYIAAVKKLLSFEKLSL